MRAGYLAVALAVAGTLLLGLLAGWSPPPTGPGAIATALGVDGPDPPGLATRRALAVIGLTRVCMTGLGLPYPGQLGPGPAIPDAGLDPEAWAARWGFGISTAVEVPAASPEVDPVAAWIAALPPPGRARYVRALYGDGATTGCATRANDAVYRLRERLLMPLRDELATVDTAVEADDAMVDVRERWRRCATDAAGPLGVAPDSVDRAPFVQGVVGAIARRLDAAGTTPAARVATQELERRVALALARCETAFARARARIAAPYESRFVATHGPLLARIGEAIRATEAAYPTPPP